MCYMSIGHHTVLSLSLSLFPSLISCKSRNNWDLQHLVDLAISTMYAISCRLSRHTCRFLHAQVQVCRDELQGFAWIVYTIVWFLI